MQSGSAAGVDGADCPLSGLKPGLQLGLRDLFHGPDADGCAGTGDAGGDASAASADECTDSDSDERVHGHGGAGRAHAARDGGDAGASDEPEE